MGATSETGSVTGSARTCWERLRVGRGRSWGVQVGDADVRMKSVRLFGSGVDVVAAEGVSDAVGGSRIADRSACSGATGEGGRAIASVGTTGRCAVRCNGDRRRSRSPDGRGDGVDGRVRGFVGPADALGGQVEPFGRDEVQPRYPAQPVVVLRAEPAGRR
jgi:hypothetical protein